MDETGKVSVLTSSTEYFAEVLTQALEKRRLQVPAPAADYIVKLLDFYVTTPELKLNTTFAELFLSAQQAERSAKLEMLKRVGDTSLYITGFFGDSLRRKIVDIDYYAEMGGLAYASLANEIGENAQAELYYEFSRRFADYIDVLTYISQNAMIQSNADLLRLYERYVTTGSELAREQLVEKGLLITEGLKKASNQ